MKTNERMRKVLSVLLTLCMVLSYVPATAFASESDALCEHPSYSTESVPADCTTQGHNVHICTACGYSYIEYLSYSEWSAERPTGIDEDLIQTATQYRSAAKDIQISSESAMDGYTFVETAWNSGSQKTNDYAIFEGTGFDTTNALYEQYSNPVSAFEDESSKIVLDSEAETGYLYYHWCHPDNEYSYAHAGSNYTFHAYYDTTSPDSYTCDISDMSYRTDHSSCSNSVWWFVLGVNTQSYTVYDRVNVFKKLSDWSEWSFAEIQPTDTCEVETREVYRYANDVLSHDFGTDGICTVCGETCAHSGGTATCTTQAVCTICHASYGDLGGHSLSNDTCTICGAQAQAKIGDTYYATLAEAATKVTADSNTIEVLTDVTIGENETVAFAAFATLDVAEGKTITCSGIVTIGGKNGIIFENALYYHGGDVTNSAVPDVDDPTWFQAGEGYIIASFDSTADTIMMRINNATVTSTEADPFRFTENLDIRFSGTNTLTGNAYVLYAGHGDGLDDLTLTGENGAVLNVTAGGSTDNTGIQAKVVTVNGGTVNITGGDAGSLSKGIDATTTIINSGIVNIVSGSAENFSIGIECSGGVTVAAGATLNLTCGEAMIAYGASSISGAGTVNGLGLVTESADSFGYQVYGSTVLTHDLTAYEGTISTFIVPEGTTLTVNEGVTLDLSGLTLDAIDFSGTIVNNGTIKLPSTYEYETIPTTITGGTVTIGEKSYSWNGEKWVCDESSHVEGNPATCTSKAVCTVCGESYGNLADHNWSDGVCTYGCDTTHDPHSWANGICTVCGYQCVHSTTEYTDNGDGTHSFACTTCGTTGTEAHTLDSTTGYCAKGCGANLAVAAVLLDDYTYYTTVDAAFAAAKTAGTGTVCVLVDCALNTATDMAGTTVGLMVGENVTLTLNQSLKLNGKIYGGGTVTGSAAPLELCADGSIIGCDFQVLYIISYGELTGGTYNCRVYNAGLIRGGVFKSEVENGTSLFNATISGGSFEKDVTNYRQVTGGEFAALVLNSGSITGGTYNATLHNYEGATVTNHDKSAYSLGDSFSITNEGTVDCTDHIWAGGTCRLCAKVCDHSGNTNTSTDLGNGTHSFTCSVCGGTSSESHTPDADSYTDKGDGTHSFECTVCGGTGNESHTPDADGCTDNSGTTHSYTCGLCGVKVTEAHTFAEGTCTVCGIIGGYCGGEGDGTNLVWTLVDSGTLTISGTGAMGDTGGVGDHKSNISSVTIGAGVTTISNDAFNANNGWVALQTLNLPDSLTTIGERAFMLTSPTAVTIPAGVTSIGAQAFWHCPILATVTIPASVTSIGDAAFGDCDELTTVNVPCNWDSSLYTFGDGVTVNQPDHTIDADSPPDIGDGTHSFTCTACGASLPGYCDENMDSTTGKCTVCDTFIAEASVTSGGTVTYYPYVDLVLDETATVLKSGDTVCLLKNYETSANLVIPEGITFDGGEFTLTSAGSGTLENKGTITGGTFSSSVANNGTITGGTFNYNVDNYNTTIGGTFESLEFVAGTIGGTVKITSSLKIWGDTFSADTLINLSNADLGEEISLNYNHIRIMYVGEHIVLPEGYCVFTEDGVYTETLNSDTRKYVIRKHSHELNGYGYDGNNHWQTCDCGYADTTPHTPTYSASGNVITASCSKCKATLGTATISAVNATYNGNEQETATVAYSDGWTGSELTVTYENNTNAGTATASITIGEATASVDFTIEKAKLTVTAHNRSIIYGSEPANGGVYYEGFVNNETESVLGGSLEYEYNYAKGNDVGNYTITPKGLTSDNYEIKFVSGTLNVLKADPAYTAPAANTLTYNGKAQALVTEGKTNDGTMQYCTTVDGTYESSSPTATHAGIYTVYYMVVGDSNHNDVAADSVTVTISPKTITELTFVGLNEVYAHTGQAIVPTFTVKDGETTLTENTDYTVAITGNTDVGTATISITLTGNYSGTVTKTFEIKTHVHEWSYSTSGTTITATCSGTIGNCPNAEQSVTLIVPENFTYTGDASPRATIEGGIDGVTLQVFYKGENTEYSYDTPTDAGTYTVMLSASGIVGVSAEVTDTFTIYPKDIANCDASLAQSSFVYSGEAPVLTVTVVDNGVGSTTLTEDTDYTVGAVSGINAGSHKLTVTGKGNYTGTVELDYSITAREVTITGAAIEPVTYNPNGYTLNVTGVTFDGVVEGESLDYTASAEFDDVNFAGEMNAAVTVTLNNSNYTLSKRNYPATVIVNQATPDYTAPTANDLTYTGEDQALVTAGTTADGTMMYKLGEDGEYTNNIPTGNAAGDYIVWYYVKGDANHTDSEPVSIPVKIGKAAAAYEASTANTLTYDGSAQTLLTAGTTADGTMMYKLGENGTYSAAVPTAEDAGTYTVYYYVKGDSNHEDSAEQKIDVTIQQLDITGKTVDITLTDSLTYNGTEQTMGVSSATLGDLTVTCTVSGNTGTNAADYTLTVTGTGNFKGTASKEWSIAQKSVTVTAENQTIAYGETISGTEITADGLVNGHSVTVTLTPSTADVTVSGTITASAAVITADGTDVTANYNVTYTSGKLVIEPDTSMIDALTAENVTSANEEDIKAVQAMMASAETDGIDEAAAEQWAAITAKCEDLLEKIEAVEAENARIADAAADYDLSTVKSSDEAAIAELIADINEQLATNNLTDEERSELEGLKTKCNNLIAKIDGTETLIAQLDKTVDDLDAETVKSTDKAALEQVIADAQTLIDSGNVTEAEKEALRETQEDAQALIKVIDDTAAENKALTDQAATFDEDTVKSTDKTVLEQLAQDIEDLLDTQNLTEDERTALEAVLEQVEGMIDTINETAEDSKAATDAIDALDPATVTSDDKDELEQAIATIDELLKDDHLTEEERSALIDAKADGEALIDVIEAAQDATDTENTEKVEDVTAENVKPEDKDALEDAKADLEKALEDNAGNYTEEEKQAIQDEIQRIEDAIEALENVEDVTETITQLPETVEPDDEETAEKILDAKKAYDELTDHEKSLVDETTKEKLDGLVAALTAYDIIKGDGGKWTKGSSYGLSFTANGPFSKFVGIEVDGKEVASTYYTAEDGSTVITLKQSFLKRLSTGEHTITVLYTDGETSGTFKILAASSTPATGDDSNIMLWSGMLCVSTLGLVVLLADRKRRRSPK